MEDDQRQAVCVRGLERGLDVFRKETTGPVTQPSEPMCVWWRAHHRNQEAGWRTPDTEGGDKGT